MHGYRLHIDTPYMDVKQYIQSSFMIMNSYHAVTFVSFFHEFQNDIIVYGY